MAYPSAGLCRSLRSLRGPTGPSLPARPGMCVARGPPRDDGESNQSGYRIARIGAIVGGFIGQLHRATSNGLIASVDAPGSRPAIRESTRAGKLEPCDWGGEQQVSLRPAKRRSPAGPTARLLRLLNQGLHETPHARRAMRSNSHRSPHQTVEFAQIQACVPGLGAETVPATARTALLRRRGSRSRVDQAVVTAG
jgi:hypothetical protein